MNSYSEEIKNSIDSFQETVQKMSSKIQAASGLWKDEKFSELTEGVSAIARQSRDVLISGDRLCESIDKFFAIAEEEYG